MPVPGSSTAARIANFAVAQIGWFACVAGAASDLVWPGAAIAAAAVAVHLALAADRSGEAKLIAVVTALGVVTDSVYAATGLLSYAAPWPPVTWVAPLWIAALWALFATTLNSSLAWLRGRPILAAALGAACGPLSYLSGERLGAVVFAHGTGLTLAILAVIWSALVPLLATIGARSRSGMRPGRETVPGRPAASP